MVQSKTKPKPKPIELTCHFRVGRPFSDHSTHALNSFIQIHCTHQSQTTHTQSTHTMPTIVRTKRETKGSASGVFSTRLAHPEHVSHVIRLSHCQVLRSSIRPLCSADWIVRFAAAAVWHQVRTHTHTHKKTDTETPTQLDLLSISNILLHLDTL